MGRLCVVEEIIGFLGIVRDAEAGLRVSAAALTVVGSVATVVPVYAAKEAAKDSAAAAAAPAAGKQPAQANAPARKPSAPLQRFDIDDFAVQGAEKLPQVEIEEAIYPFLGPGKTSEDVEKARAALEKAYHDKGIPDRQRRGPAAERDRRRGHPRRCPS